MGFQWALTAPSVVLFRMFEGSLLRLCVWPPLSKAIMARKIGVYFNSIHTAARFGSPPQHVGLLENKKHAKHVGNLP